MTSAIKVVVTGKVQGVMFRDFTKRKAEELQLVGEVANQPDGSVRVHAEGEENVLNIFTEALKKGPSFAQVDTVECSLVEPTENFTSFNIVYD